MNGLLSNLLSNLNIGFLELLAKSLILKWCPLPDLNWQARRLRILSPLCLPISPRGQTIQGHGLTAPI